MDSEIENDLKKETHSEMESLEDEKNKLKTISLEKVSQYLKKVIIYLASGVNPVMYINSCGMYVWAKIEIQQKV